jgi:SPOR domain
MAVDRSDDLSWLDTMPAARAAPPGSAPATSRRRNDRAMWLGGAAALLITVGGVAYQLGTLQVPWRERSAPTPRAAVRAPTPVAVAKTAPPVAEPAPAPILPVPVAEAPPAPIDAVDPLDRAERRAALPAGGDEDSVEDLPEPRLSNRVRERLRTLRLEARREEAAQAAREHRPVPRAAPNTRFALVPPGPKGRIVQLGNFTDVPLAQEQWRLVAKRWPYLMGKPRIVTPVWTRQNDQWALDYRLQIGTASQAQSLVICQRLQKAGQPCVVVY